MKEATMVYQLPGPFLVEKFSGVNYTTVDAHEVEAKLAEGWFRTVLEAVEADEAAKKDAANKTVEQKRVADMAQKRQETIDSVNSMTDEASITDYAKALGLPTNGQHIGELKTAIIDALTPKS